MSVEVREEVPEREALWSLFLTTGWNKAYHFAPADLHRAFASSWRVVAAYEEGRLVGMGRVVTDAVMHAMIYDLIVAPDRQRMGIGDLMLRRLVESCRGCGIRDIQLFCAKGRRVFYEKRGFAARPEDAPGMQYVPDGRQDTSA